MADAADKDLELYRLGHGRVLAVRLTDGSTPALDFLNMHGKSKNKFKILFERLLSQGKITNQERFRKIESQGSPSVFEFKVHDGKGLRLYAVQDGTDWCVTHGRTKPSDKKVDAEATKARDLYSQRKGRP